MLRDVTILLLELHAAVAVRFMRLSVLVGHIVRLCRLSVSLSLTPGLLTHKYKAAVRGVWKVESRFCFGS